MKNFIYYTPTKVFFGKNEEDQIGKIIKEYHFKKVLLHYGMSSIKKIGLYDKIIKALADAEIEVFELGGVTPNPKLSLVKQGVKICKDNNIEMILAVGGGSVIDSAKSIAVGAKVEFDPWCFSIKTAVPETALPVGVILTLSAAGSEMSNSCVITNEETLEKRGFNTELNRPLFAVLNPELTFTVSKYQTGCGIVDIMMHTLERYFADPIEVTPLTDGIALALLKEVMVAGKKAILDPSDYEARATLMWASSLSHNGLTGLGKSFQMSVHQIEHEISGMYDEVAHGAGLAVLWPAWAKLAYTSDIEHFKRFAYEVMEIEATKEIENDILKAIEKLKNYFQEIGMPVTLSELGIPEERFIELAENYSVKGTRVIEDIIKVDYDVALKILRLAK